MNHFIFTVLSGLCAALIAASPLSARDVGYRNIMLGQSKDQAGQAIKANFGAEYVTSAEGDNALVVRKMQGGKAVMLIELLFDHNNILYRINIKMRKVPGNPAPDDVIKIVQEKYGSPVKRDITSQLDMVARWRLDNDRYDIFFHNISSWDKYDVQYTDTVLLKKKEAYDIEMKRKPVNRELDF